VEEIGGMSGKFVWHDLMSTDPDKAKAFYAGLLGWNIAAQDMGPETGVYNMVMVGAGGHGLGGIVSLDPSHGMPSHWMSYLAMPDGVDAACAKVTELGGSVPVPPMDIPGVGRFAVAADPQGAHFSPFQYAEQAEVPPYPAPGTPGGVAWNELMTKDPEAAVAFYGAVAGWRDQVMDVGTGPYHVQASGEEMVAGIMGNPDPTMPPAWLIYFEITQPTMEEALAKVTELGGTVAMGPMEVPTVGTLGAAQDPTGAWFCLMKSAPM
jgi:uncharacterized protein